MSRNRILLMVAIGEVARISFLHALEEELVVRARLGLQRDDVVALGFLSFALSEVCTLHGIPWVLF